MYRVYRARERYPDRAVVVKGLEISATAHIGRERFFREIDLTFGLSHPYIVLIFAAGDADGALYYVMPFITGETSKEGSPTSQRLVRSYGAGRRTSHSVWPASVRNH